MSKGNLFVGNGQGKVGNVVLSKLHGEQITRAYQNQVANPRTYGQAQQRAMFSQGVKFYKRAITNFFAFAFEDKKNNESDFNAFMRHNVKNAVVVSRDLYKDIAFPALGSNWLLSDGSLYVNMSVVFPTEGGAGVKLGMTPQAETVGAVSKCLLAAGAEAGDIFTFVLVRKGFNVGQSGALSSAITETGNNTISVSDSSLTTPPEWSILQFVIDVNDDTPLSQVATKGAKSANDGFYLTTASEIGGVKIFDASLLSYTGEYKALNDYNEMGWAAAIVTRKVNGTLKATHSELWPNLTAATYIQQAKNEDDWDMSLESWRGKLTESSSEAILKGGVASGLSSGSTATGTAADGQGKINKVNGSATTPITMKNKGLGGADNPAYYYVKCTGVMLDQIQFTGTNLLLLNYDYNNLNTAVTITCYLRDYKKPGSLLADGVVIVNIEDPNGNTTASE